MGGKLYSKVTQFTEQYNIPFYTREVMLLEKELKQNYLKVHKNKLEIEHIS